MSSPNLTAPGRLPPTTEALFDDSARPYFLWWTDATVGQLKKYLASPDPEERAYWMGALLREANTRDVWVFVNADEIRALWPHLIRYLGRSRDMWAWLLKLPPPDWPPCLVRDEGDTREPLGSRLAARFAGLGLTQDIPELCGEPARPADFES